MNDISLVFDVQQPVYCRHPCDVLINLLEKTAALARIDPRIPATEAYQLANKILRHLTELRKNASPRSVSVVWGQMRVLAEWFMILSEISHLRVYKTLFQISGWACMRDGFGHAEADTLGEAATAACLRWTRWDQHRLRVLIEYHGQEARTPK
jgi:hypothetical protein